MIVMIVMICTTIAVLYFWRGTQGDALIIRSLRWRLSLAVLELLITFDLIFVEQSPEPLALRIGWSLLNLLIFGTFAYYFDHQPLKR